MVEDYRPSCDGSLVGSVISNKSEEPNPESEEKGYVLPWLRNQPKARLLSYNSTNSGKLKWNVNHS